MTIMSVFPRASAARLCVCLAYGVATLSLTLSLTACKPDITPKLAGLVVPEKQETEKLNAYVVAYNKLLQWHDFGDILKDYRRSNPKINARGNPPLDRYSVNGNDVDAPLQAFDRAMAISESLPELDEPAKALKAALEAVNPLLKEVDTYEKTKEYLSDKGVKARAMDAPFVAALIAAGKATSAFGTALSKQTLKRDEAELASLTTGTVRFHKLKVSLEVRKLATAVRTGLADKAQIANVAAPLQALSLANAELGTLKRDPNAKPAWDPVCEMYKSSVDSLMGATRTLVGLVEARDSVATNSAATAWSNARNKTVEASNQCGH
ncbi:hypothetical protein BH11PSE13_BH11PSE13_27610 [soil metagenome]